MGKERLCDDPKERQPRRLSFARLIRRLPTRAREVDLSLDPRRSLGSRLIWSRLGSKACNRYIFLPWASPGRNRVRSRRRKNEWWVLLRFCAPFCFKDHQLKKRPDCVASGGVHLASSVQPDVFRSKVVLCCLASNSAVYCLLFTGTLHALVVTMPAYTN